MAEELEFLNMGKRDANGKPTRFRSSEYRIEKKTSEKTGRVTYFAVAKTPEGKEAWKIIPKPASES